MLRVLPIQFQPTEHGPEPRDPKLHTAVQAWCEKQFGEKMDFTKYGRAWAVLRVEGEDFQVLCVGATWVRIECPIFHCVPLEETKDGLRECETARDLLFERMHGSLEDDGFRGKSVLVFVEEKAVRYWRRFLSRIGATPAPRFDVPI